MAQPLQPAVVPIILGKLDTKTAPKLAQQGTLTEADDVQMTQTGRIVKRNGCAALNKPAGMTSGRKLVSFNGELTALTADAVWSYSPAGQTWSQRGTWSTVQPVVENIVSDGGSQTNVDVAVGGGYACFVWTDVRLGVYTFRYTIQDLATGTAIVQSALIVGGGGGVGGSAKVVFLNAAFVVCVKNSTGWRAFQILLATPAVVGAPVALAVTNGTTDHAPWDIVAVPALDRIALAYGDSTNVLGCFLLDPVTMALSAPSLPGGIPVVATATMAWLLDDFSDFRLYLAVHSGVQLNVYTLLPNGGAWILFAAENITGGAGVEAQITGWVDRATTPMTKWTLTHSPGAGSKTLFDLINRGSFQTGVGATFAPLIRGAGLASRVWRYSTVPFVTITYEGGQNSATVPAIQQTYLVARADTGSVNGPPDFVSRFLGTLGAGMRPVASHVASVVAIPGTTRYVTAQSRKVQVGSNTQAEGNAPVIVKSAARVFFDMADPALSPPRALGFGLYLPGGTIRRYDQGASPELGFHVYPEAPAVASSGVASTGMAGGTYSYVTVYCELDKYGALHRSAPSLPTTVVLAPNIGANVTYPMLRLTGKGTVFIEIYRANPGDPNFYKVTPTQSGTAAPANQAQIFNDPTADTGLYFDPLPDASLLGREPLYTTGVVFQNDAPPPARIVQQHRDRIWLAGQDLASRLLPSKPILPDQGLAFSLNFGIALDPNDGEVTAMASMDDKLFVFTAMAVYWIGGDGPGVTGQGTFSTPFRLPFNAGTTEPESVVLCDDGLRFRSSNAGGIVRIGRDMSSTYIGVDVEGFNSVDISGAVSVPQNQQTRFVSAAGTTLVRDEYHQRWYRWRNQRAAHACLFQGVFTFIAPDGTVYQETPGQYGDAGAPILQRYTLAPLSPFAPGGNGRLWALQLIGDYSGPHTIRVGFKYDHTDYIWEELTIDAASACAGDIYGANIYGVGTYGGSVPGDYRFEIRPSEQRFSAVELTIEEINTDGSLSAGLDLSALAMLIGAQPGSLAKLPASRMMVTR